MPRAAIRNEVAHLVDCEQAPTYHVLGPTVQYLTPADDDRAPCLMHGVIPPGVASRSTATRTRRRLFTFQENSRS